MNFGLFQGFYLQNDEVCIDTSNYAYLFTVCEDGKIKNVSLLPACINRNAQPQVVRPEDPRFGEIASYLDEINEVAELNGKIRMEGRELHVIGTGAQSDSLR